MIRVKSGIVEIKTKDPYLRSFLVAGEEASHRVNVWSNSKNSFYTMSLTIVTVRGAKKQLYKSGLHEEQVREILNNPFEHFKKIRRKRCNRSSLTRQ